MVGPHAAWAPGRDHFPYYRALGLTCRGDHSWYPDSQIGEAFSYAKEFGWLRTVGPRKILPTARATKAKWANCAVTACRGLT